MALDSYMDVVRQAAQEEKTLMLTYVSPITGKFSTREVEPYEIGVSKKGEEVFWAYDIAGGSIKQFLTRGVTHVEITENTFTPQFPIQIY